MVRVDNDPTKTIAVPFIICAGVRTGGTYLAHSLSNHPQVFCDRGESMHRLSVWRSRASQVDGWLLLHLLTHQEGYHASGFRMVYSQARPLISHILKEHCKVIMLRRENVLRQSVSWLYHQMVRKGMIEYFPVHTFDETDAPAMVTLQPDQVLKWCRQFENAHIEMTEQLKSLPQLQVEYAQMVGGEGETSPKMNRGVSFEICDFLGVDKKIMSCDLKRVHQHPLHALIKNWQDVVNVIQDSEYARFLEDETNWKKKGKRWVKEV